MSDRSESGKIVIILRCPYCDSIAIRPGKFNHWFYVQCEDCKAIGPKAYSEQEALGKWNKRRATPGTNEYGHQGGK